jgi:putative dimethyl sulfoxide reductase chaperone
MEELNARANIYALISRILLQELDSKFIDTLKNDDAILDFLPNVKTWEPLQTLSNEELLNKHFNVDFTNISLLHLIPYETFYTRDDQMIETGGANPVTNMYNEFSFLVDFEIARVVSADHIGVEFEFMYHLIEGEKEAMLAKDIDAVNILKKAQHTFLNKHLLNWAPHYLISAKYESRTPLYHDACEMALEFILSENEMFTEALGKNEFAK